MKVLLLFSGTRQIKPTMPFSVVVLASYLRKKNVAVDILDSRVDSYKDVDYAAYSLIGISSKSGEQVSSAVEICKWIRAKCQTPIVFGGPHATFFPEQTCESELADFVVRAEGEETLYELVQALEKGTGFDHIKSLTYKDQKNGQVKSNPDRAFMNMEELDIPAYDLIDLDKYQDKFQYFTIETSRGCPFRCTFCYVHDFHKRMWRVKKISQCINEIKQIKRDHGIRKIFICDDNFFVMKDRVIEFAQQVVEEKLDIEIFTQARANYFSQYTDDELEILAKAGVKYVAIGAESGSERMLDIIEKDITIKDIRNSATNCIRYGMVPVYSFVIGMPGEEKDDLNKSIDMYFELKQISPDVEINGFYIFTPYPGTPVFHEAVKKGYKPCTSLEDWAKWKFSDLSNLPWLTKRDKIELQILSKVILFLFVKDRFKSYGTDFQKKKLGSSLNNFLWNMGSFFLNIDARFRLKHKLFSFGYEWLLFGKIADKFKVT